MAKWEASYLGCHCCQHVGTVVGYADTAATGVGRVADQAANMKSAKYADFATSCIFRNPSR